MSLPDLEIVRAGELASSAESDLVAPLARVTELAYQGAPEGSGVLCPAATRGVALACKGVAPECKGYSPNAGGSSADADSTTNADSPASSTEDAPVPDNPDAGLLRLAVLLRPQVPMRQLVAVGPVAAMAVLSALEELGANPDAIGIAWPHDVVLIGDEAQPSGKNASPSDFVSLATLSTKAGYADGMFVALGIDINARALANALSTAAEATTGQDATAAASNSQGDRAPNGGDAGSALSAIASDLESFSTDAQLKFARTLQAHLVSAMREWEKNAATPNAKAGPWAPFLQDYFDRVPLLGQAVNVCYPNGRVYARGIFVGIDIWGRATVRTRRAGDIEFPAEKFRIEPQSY